MSLYWGQHVRSDEFAAASEGLGAVFQELWRERPLWGYGRPNTFRSTVVRDAKRHVEAQARGLLRVFCFHYIRLPLTLDSRVEPHFNPLNKYSPILPFHELLEDRTTSSRHFLSSSRLAQGISPEKVRAGFPLRRGLSGPAEGPALRTLSPAVGGPDGTVEDRRGSGF